MNTVSRYVPNLYRQQVRYEATASEPIGLGETVLDVGVLNDAIPLTARLQDQVRAHNDEVIDACQANVKEGYEEDGQLNRALRWRSLAWASSDGSGAATAAQEQLSQTAISSKLRDFDQRLPAAFRFSDHPERMHLYWSALIAADESAILRPTPSMIMRGERSNRELMLPDVDQEVASASSGKKTKAKKSKSKMPRQGEKSAPSDPTGASNVLLTVSVYSRPLLKPNRAEQKHVRTQKRLDRLQEESTGSRSSRKRKKDPADNDDHRTLNEGAGMNATALANGTNGHDIFQPRLGPASAADDEPWPAQIIQIYASQTLADLRKAIICRMDEMPEREKSDNSTDGLYDRARFTGAKRPSEAMMLVEKTLYGEKCGQAASNLLRYLASTKQKQDDDSMWTDATGSARDLSEVRFMDLPSIHLHVPYWLCHQGVCEHFWTIDEVRLPTADDPMPPSAESQSEYVTPVTTFLAKSATVRPTSLYARDKGGDNHYSMGLCGMCSKDMARYAIVGGVSVGEGGTIQSEGADARDASLRLPSMPSMVETVCEACMSALVGVEDEAEGADEDIGPSRRVRAEAKGARSDQGKGKGKGKARASDATAENPSAAEPSESHPVSSTPAHLPRTQSLTDVSDRPAWRAIKQRLAVERGWTVVPLLD